MLRVAAIACTRLRPGIRVVGPAIIEEDTATLWLPKGARAIAGADGSLLVDPG